MIYWQNIISYSHPYAFYCNGERSPKKFVLEYLDYWLIKAGVSLCHNCREVSHFCYFWSLMSYNLERTKKNVSESCLPFVMLCLLGFALIIWDFSHSMVSPVRSTVPCESLSNIHELQWLWTHAALRHGLSEFYCLKNF